MSVTLSQDLNRAGGLRQVNGGVGPRALKDATQSPSQSAQNATPQGQGVKSSAEVMALLDTDQLARAGYDEPDQRQQKAISAYQSFASQDKREQLQQMFAVDLYA
ncbi:hypothetical protein [Rheinheimera sp. F8]|uniref:hypothetical protein n=1 Tax=Rheinheimera sp. F8 TaxID=1763998 RepID=UPI00074493C4|nr:hypothetical protein [Rheinheimera sp. F8]ALZ74404.1 hypothetical protein ATY27_00570 [Rheinheimera sp. F8]